MKVMNDNLPDPEQVVEEAIENKTSVSDIAGRYTTGSKSKNRLVVRVHRYLDRTPGGEKLKEYLLKDGSWHRLNASARLVTQVDTESKESSVVELMVNGGVPIVSLSRGAPEKRNTYSFWYTQISRNRPGAIEYVLDKEAPSLELRKTEAESSGASSQYFDISTHEFGPVT